MLLFDDPITDTLWVGKAVPHEWFSPTERIRCRDMPSRFGPPSPGRACHFYKGADIHLSVLNNSHDRVHL
jgi:hypothetical protein